MTNAVVNRSFHPEVIRGGRQFVEALSKPSLQTEDEEAVETYANALLAQVAAARANHFANINIFSLDFRSYFSTKEVVGTSTEMAGIWALNRLGRVVCSNPMWLHIGRDKPIEQKLPSLKRSAAVSHTLQRLHLLELQEIAYLDDDAVPRFKAAYKDAIKFADMLADEPSATKIGAADDGEILFEWYHEKNSLVVGLDGDGEYGYSYEIDGQILAGSYPGIIDEDLPTDLRDFLRSIGK